MLYVKTNRGFIAPSGPDKIGKDSVIAIPLWQSDGYHPDEKPNSAQERNVPAFG
jgi:hypothetical protein